MPADGSLKNWLLEATDFWCIQQFPVAGKSKGERGVIGQMKWCGCTAGSAPHLRNTLQCCLVTLEVSLAISSTQQEIFPDVSELGPDKRFTEHSGRFKVKPKRKRIGFRCFPKFKRFPRSNAFSVTDRLSVGNSIQIEDSGTVKERNKVSGLDFAKCPRAIFAA